MWQLWAIYFPQKKLIDVALTQFSDAEMQKFAPKKNHCCHRLVTLQENMVFFTQKTSLMAHVWINLVVSSITNSQYVMFIVTYIILKMGS